MEPMLFVQVTIASKKEPQISNILMGVLICLIFEREVSPDCTPSIRFRGPSTGLFFGDLCRRLDMRE